MNPDEFDRLLSGEPEIEPRATFTHSVMAAVRREAETPAPLPFPWRRAGWGLVASATLGAVLGAAIGSVGMLPDEDTLRSAVNLVSSGDGQAAVAAVAALVASWLLSVLPMRWFGLRG